ncbi:MAG: hypothetical protein J6D10_08705, partial [Clostridia bacterium]|nr:hypothetical protein [Clostridia bacterium]
MQKVFPGKLTLKLYFPGVTDIRKLTGCPALLQNSPVFLWFIRSFLSEIVEQAAERGPDGGQQ